MKTRLASDLLPESRKSTDWENKMRGEPSILHLGVPGTPMFAWGCGAANQPLGKSRAERAKKRGPSELHSARHPHGISADEVIGVFFGDIQRGIFKLHLKPERAQVPPMKQWPATKRRPSNIREKRLLMETVCLTIQAMKTAYPCRRMPSAWMREASVVGFMPSSCAAPRDPETRPPLARRAASMFTRS